MSLSNLKLLKKIRSEQHSYTKRIDTVVDVSYWISVNQLSNNPAPVIKSNKPVLCCCKDSQVSLMQYQAVFHSISNISVCFGFR